jgi:hypothetical protein
MSGLPLYLSPNGDKLKVPINLHRKQINKMRIKYANYEALLIHEKGNRSGFGCDFAIEALRRFKASKTAVKMVLFVSTHNNTRLKKYAEYGMEFK